MGRQNRQAGPHPQITREFYLCNKPTTSCFLAKVRGTQGQQSQYHNAVACGSTSPSPTNIVDCDVDPCDTATNVCSGDQKKIRGATKDASHLHPTPTPVYLCPLPSTALKSFIVVVTAKVPRVSRMLPLIPLAEIEFPPAPMWAE